MLDTCMYRHKCILNKIQNNNIMIIVIVFPGTHHMPQLELIYMADAMADVENYHSLQPLPS